MNTTTTVFCGRSTPPRPGSRARPRRHHGAEPQGPRPAPAAASARARCRARRPAVPRRQLAQPRIPPPRQERVVALLVLELIAVSSLLSLRLASHEPPPPPPPPPPPRAFLCPHGPARSMAAAAEGRAGNSRRWTRRRAAPRCPYCSNTCASAMTPMGPVLASRRCAGMRQRRRGAPPSPSPRRGLRAPPRAADRADRAGQGGARGGRAGGGAALFVGRGGEPSSGCAGGAGGEARPVLSGVEFVLGGGGGHGWLCVWMLFKGKSEGQGGWKEVSVLERSATGWDTILPGAAVSGGSNVGRQGPTRLQSPIFSNIPINTKTLSALCGSPEAIG